MQTTVNLAQATFVDPSAFALPTGSVAWIEAVFVGRDTATQAGVRLVSSGVFGNDAGVVSLSGALVVTVPAGTVALVACVPTLTVQGLVVSPQVTGIALTTVEWFVDVQIVVT